MQGWQNIYFYSIFLGLRYFLKKPLNFSKEALKRILIPMDIARYFEIPATFRFLSAARNEKILDLSSPKLLSFYLAERIGSKITATDIWKDEIVSWKQIREALGRSGGLKLEVADGRKLQYKNKFFDKAFTISVVEHIPGEGDSLCMKELARVLRPGGKVVLTTPLSRNYQELWVKRNVYGKKFAGKKIFLSRQYDKKSLFKRLIAPSGLKLKKMIICEEKFPVITSLYTKFFPMSTLLGPTFPIFASVSLNQTRKIGKKNNVLLILKKDK